MALLDLAIIVAYLVGILIFAMAKRKPAGKSAVDYMLDGRKLTCPLLSRHWSATGMAASLE